MELWVRSQNKEFLVKVERAYYYREPLTDPDDVVHRITTGKETLGKYESKERCLEILDEIQKILMADPVPLLVFTNCDVTEDTYNGLNEMYKKGDLLAVCGASPQNDVKAIEKSTFVYQMPEK